MYDFEYARPGSLHDVRVLTNDESVFLAGGQTLIPAMKQRLADPFTLLDLSGVTELRGIVTNSTALGIGAMSTHAEVARNPSVNSALPALAELAGNIGDPQVRNRGTIGGAIATNDPAADYPAALLALDALIITDKRHIPADQFFNGFFSTALEPGELIVSIGFPLPDAAAYAKFEQQASRYALVGVFVAKFGDAVRVAVTGAGSGGVFRATDIEVALLASCTPEAAKAVTVSPDEIMSEMHASAEYRAAMIPVMASRAVANLK